MTRGHHATTLGSLGLCALLLTGCAGSEVRGTTEEEEEQEEVPHGHVEGAEEAAEPQSRLVVADVRSGGVQVIDLITEEVTELDPVEGLDGVIGDGRFAYLLSSDDGMTHVVDSGAWTVDHGDHRHYYRAEAGPVGLLDDHVARHVSTDRSLTTLVGDGGGTAVLDREALEAGTVETAAPGLDGARTALPFAEHLVVAEDDAEGTVRVHDRDGSPLEALDGTCAEPLGQAVTRRGPVIGCADGVLHVTEDDGVLTGESIPYPDGAEGRVEEFHHRAGSDTLASVSTDGDVWVLDLAEGRWAEMGLPDTVAVTAVGAGAPVLALTDDGTLHSLDPETGEELARTALLTDPDPDAEHAPVIQVDTGRAYVNDAATRTIHEIDYNDDLRVARTFDTGITPHLMVETGQ